MQLFLLYITDEPSASFECVSVQSFACFGFSHSHSLFCFMISFLFVCLFFIFLLFFIQHPEATEIVICLFAGFFTSCSPFDLSGLPY